MGKKKSQQEIDIEAFDKWQSREIEKSMYMAEPTPLQIWLRAIQYERSRIRRGKGEKG